MRPMRRGFLPAPAHAALLLRALSLAGMGHTQPTRREGRMTAFAAVVGYLFLGAWALLGAGAVVLALVGETRRWRDRRRWRRAMREAERFLRHSRIENGRSHRPECQCRTCWDRCQAEGLLAECGYTGEVA